MKLFSLFRESPDEVASQKIYREAVRQARSESFYRDLGVPDTAEGRFELIALHVFLILHRLKLNASSGNMGQALFDLMFADMDQNLREMGVGDLRVGKKVKSMAESFYGRIAAYEAGLGGENAPFAEALKRNIYQQAQPSQSQLDLLIDYIRRETSALASLSDESLAAGNGSFGPPPSADGEGK